MRRFDPSAMVINYHSGNENAGLAAAVLGHALADGGDARRNGRDLEQLVAVLAARSCLVARLADALGNGSAGGRVVTSWLESAG